MVEVLNTFGKVEAIGLKVQLNLAGRGLLCGEESALTALCCSCCEETSDLLRPASTLLRLWEYRISSSIF